MGFWLPECSPGLAEPKEMDHSYSETWDTNGGVVSTVNLKCPWVNRHAIMNLMLTTPVEWPYLPGEQIFASNGSIVPFPGIKNAEIVDTPSGLLYALAQLTVNFEMFSIDGEGPSEIYSESIEPTAEFITIPHTDFRWGSAAGTALKLEEAPGRLDIGLDYVVNFLSLTSIPAGALTLIGKVNSSAVTSPSLGMTFATETLLFNPPKISRSIVFGGTNKYSMQVRYTYKPNGWNKFWRADASPAAYEYMYHKDGGGTPYKNFQPASFAGMVP